MSVQHDAWSIERHYAHTPPVVFAAWAQPAVKIRWFDLSDGGAENWTTDFRVGGVERFDSPPGTHPAVSYAGRYLDIVDDRRIVLVYDIHVGARRTCVVLGTTEFTADDDRGGTLLRYTEQSANLDGLSTPAGNREVVAEQLSRLARVLGAG